ncbi:MAG: family 43 glycosylhydrolase [Planctomycetaceae bacterium]
MCRAHDSRAVDAFVAARFQPAVRHRGCAWRTMRVVVSVACLAVIQAGVRDARSAERPADLAHVDVATTPITAFAPRAGCDRHDPSNVVRWGDRFWVWYTHNVDDHRQVAIHVGSSVDGVRWEDHGLALGGGVPGAWDESGVLAPYVVLHDDAWHLWYTGFHGGDLATRDLGMATAPSPRGPWTRLQANPLLRRSPQPLDWDSGMLGDSTVLHREGRWWLYYKSRRAGETNLQTRIGVATADVPTGPYRRHPGNPLFPGHAFSAWPHAGGVAAVGGVVSPALLWSADGIHFEHAGTLATESTGLFTPRHGERVDERHRWGVEVESATIAGRPARGLRRFDWWFGR